MNPWLRSPIPTNTLSTSRGCSHHCCGTARPQAHAAILPAGTHCDPARQHLPQGRAAAACAGSSFPWERAARAARSLPPPLAAPRRAARLAPGPRVSQNHTQHMCPEQPHRWLYLLHGAWGASKWRLPCGTKEEPLPQRPPGWSRFSPASQQRATGPGRQRHGQPAGQAASGQGTRQPLVLRGRPATEKPAHLGLRCGWVLGGWRETACAFPGLCAPRCAPARAAACLHAR